MFFIISYLLNFPLYSQTTVQEFLGMISSISVQSSSANLSQVQKLLHDLSNVCFSYSDIYNCLCRLNDPDAFINFELKPKCRNLAKELKKRRKSIFWINKTSCVHHFIFVLFSLQDKLNNKLIKSFLVDRFPKLDFNALCRGLRRAYRAEEVFWANKDKKNANKQKNRKKK